MTTPEQSAEFWERSEPVTFGAHADRDASEQPKPGDGLAVEWHDPGCASTIGYARFCTCLGRWASDRELTHLAAVERERDELRAEVARLKAATKPAVDYAIGKTYTLDYGDLETHCVRLAVRDIGISEAEVERLTGALADNEQAYTKRVAAWSRTKARAEKAEAIVARVEALAEQWSSATQWDSDMPHIVTRAYASDLRAALEGGDDE